MNIKPKKRKCKGTGKASGYGCGKEGYIHKYGLCVDCFKEWLYNTDEGHKVLIGSTIRAKKDIEKKKRARIRKDKESIRSKSYYEKKLQFEINSIVRLIDADMGCISCDHGHSSRWTRQAHAGHFYSVGSNPTLRFNLFNIWKQCSICNNWKSGNEREYYNGLIKTYGQETADIVRSLKSKYKSINLSKEDLIDKIKVARDIKKDIMSGKDYTRKQINYKIGIYE